MRRDAETRGRVAVAEGGSAREEEDDDDDGDGWNLLKSFEFAIMGRPRIQNETTDRRV